MKTADNYDDIIHLPRPVSPRRSRMSNYDRAAQFSPFAALTGFDGVIQESARLTQRQIILEEGELAVLNAQLQEIQAQLPARPQVTFLCFQPDSRKEGGSYVRLTGRVKQLDSCSQTVLFADGRRLPMQWIYRITLENEEPV